MLLNLEYPTYDRAPPLGCCCDAADNCVGGLTDLHFCGHRSANFGARFLMAEIRKACKCSHSRTSALHTEHCGKPLTRVKQIRQATPADLRLDSSTTLWPWRTKSPPVAYVASMSRGAADTR